MSVQETILKYLSVYGKDNKYRMSRALKIDVSEITEALDVLEKEGKIEIKEGNAMLVKVKPIIEAEQEDEISMQVAEVEEQPKEVSEELIEEGLPEEISEEKKIEGTVRFYNPNKGFGFIDGDNGKGYRLQEGGIKGVVEIKAGDRVLFKPIIGYKGPEAEDVEKMI